MDDTPKLTIGSVVARIAQAYPDVTHSSLRFLEREGFIAARRTAGGHRKYSERDVALIYQIKQWQQQRLSLQDIRERLKMQSDLLPLEHLTQNFLDTVTAGKLHEASMVVLNAAHAGVSLVDIFRGILTPALIETGHRWQRGTVLVVQEKEVSELVRELVIELTIQNARHTSGQPVLVAGCVSGEHHELGLRMICGLLRAEGCRVHFLGADVAPEFLAEAVELYRPDGVLLSARMYAALRPTQVAIETITGRRQGELPRVIVGGQLAVDHAAEIAAWGAMTVTDPDPGRARTHILELLCDSTILHQSAIEQ